MSFEISKIYTDNPYVDELVYYTKLLGIGTVLKMQDQADAAETTSSLKNAELFISCLEGTAIMEVFPNDSLVMREALNKVGMTSGGNFNSYIANKQNFIDDYRKGNISKEDYEKVTQYHRDYYINNYEEENNYYRMLHGLPNLGIKTKDEFWDYVDPELSLIMIPDDIRENGFSKESKMYIQTVFGTEIHLGPIHLMNDSEIAILNQYGVIEELIKAKPDTRQYMKYLGDKRIDFYLARKAYRFDPLYIPSIESDEVYRMYKDKLDANKFYVLRTIYSEAFKYGSDYYDNFIAALIVIITMIDIISRVHEFIARKEIFDIRSVEYIFNSYGVPFFEEIPLKYQTAMVKNIHTLLKYKSTSKCMIDICSLFGFENIEIFKYYLLRDRKTNPDGSYVYAYDEEGNHDTSQEYELKFIKVPLDEDFDQYSQISTNYLDYDEVVDQDSKWDGGSDHNELTKAILNEEFNVIKTKYMSIDTIYDVTKMSVQQSYFFGMLYDNLKYESSIKLQVPFIDTAKEFEIADLFTLLTVLTYLTNGVQDTIMDTASKILYINGFNFKTDLAALATDIANKENYGAQELSDFKKPVSAIPSFKAMMDMYVNNMAVRDKLIEGMKNADNLAIYKIYKTLYDSLMTVRYTTNYYKIKPVEVDSDGKLITSPDRIITPIEDPDRLITDSETITKIKNGTYTKTDYWESNGDYYYYYFENTNSRSTNRIYYDYYRNENGVFCDYYRESIDGEEIPTYKAYLEAKEYAIYGVINQALSYTDENSKNQYIATVIDSVVYAMEEYIDSDQFQALFSNLPAMGSESVKRYISLVIDFYKSYKVDFLGLNTIYTMDDKHEGLIKIIDSMRIDTVFDKPEFINIWEKFANAIANTTKDEKVKLLEKLYFDIFTFVYFDGQSGDNHRDMLMDDTRVIQRGKNIGTTIASEKIHEINAFFTKDDYIKLLTDKFASLLVSVNPKLRIELVETLAKVLVYKNPDEIISLKEKIANVQIDISKEENIELISSQFAEVLIHITPIERIYAMEKIAEIIISKAPEEKINFLEKLYLDISTFVYFDGQSGDNHRDALSESVQLLEDIIEINSCISNNDSIDEIRDRFESRTIHTSYKSEFNFYDQILMHFDNTREEYIKLAENIASMCVSIKLNTIINSEISEKDKEELDSIIKDYIFTIVSDDRRYDGIYLLDCVAVNASTNKLERIGLHDRLWIYNSIA